MFPSRKHGSFLIGVVIGAFLLLVVVIGIYLFTKSPVPEVRQEYQWLELPLDPKLSKRKSDTIQCIVNSKYDVLLPGRRFLLIVLSHDEKSERKAKQWCMCRPWTRMLRVTSSVFFESMVYNDIPSILDAESTLPGVSPLDYVALASYRSVQMLPIEKLQTLLHLLDASKGKLNVVPLMNYGFPLMPQAKAAHTTAFQVAWDTLLLSMGYSQTDIRAVDEIEVFLRNSFITSPAWMRKVAHFMSMAMNISMTNSTVANALQQDAKYAAGTKGVPQRIFQQDYYQLHPFVFERLPVFYFHQHKAGVYTTMYDG